MDRAREGGGGRGETHAFDRPRRILRRFHRLIESSALRCDRDRIVYARTHARIASHRIASHRCSKRNARTERRNWKLKLESVPYRFAVRRRPHFYFFDPVNKQCSLSLSLHLSAILVLSLPLLSIRSAAPQVTSRNATRRLILSSASAWLPSHRQRAYFLANRALG